MRRAFRSSQSQSAHRDYFHERMKGDLVQLAQDFKLLIGSQLEDELQNNIGMRQGNDGPHDDADAYVDQVQENAPNDKQCVERMFRTCLVDRREGARLDAYGTRQRWNIMQV
jgi:hypothetical protein